MKFITFVAAIAFASTAMAQETIPVANTNVYQKVAEGAEAPAPAKAEVKKSKKAYKKSAAKKAAPKKAAKKMEEKKAAPAAK